MGSTAILLAAGSGARMQGTVPDKVLARLHGTPAFVYSVRAFIASACVEQITVVYRDDAQRRQLEETLVEVDCGDISIHWIVGGTERQDSVANALAAQDEDCEYVFIHDCARPLVSAESIQALSDAVRNDGAAVLAHPVNDTIKRIAVAGQLRSTELEDLERDRLWAMETPQAFAFDTIDAAYHHIRESGLRVTDDTAAAANIGVRCTLVPNPHPNPKITTPADIAYIQHLLNESRMADGA